jgi:hypothetical protein
MFATHLVCWLTENPQHLVLDLSAQVLYLRTCYRIT